MGQARARAAEGGTQGTARETGRGTGRTRAPAAAGKARARATEGGTQDAGRGTGGRGPTRARSWGQGESPGASKGGLT